MATTSTALKRTAHRALDLKLSSLAVQAAAPSRGWVRAIREAAGMSGSGLAASLGVVESTVLLLDHNE